MFGRRKLRLRQPNLSVDCGRGKEFVLTSDDLRQMFPGISRKVVRGLLLPGNGFTVNPQRLVRTLGELLLEAGGSIVAERATRIIPEGDGSYSLMTNIGWHKASRIVVAAGAWSNELLKPIGVRIPLETERGYHAMLTAPGIELRLPISNKSRAFGVTPMEHGLRVAGTVEIFREGGALLAQTSQEWAAHLRVLVDSSNERARLGDSARAQFEARHSLTGTAREFARYLSDPRAE